MSGLPDVDAAAQRVEALLGEFSDPAARQKAEELVRLLMEVYGAGLEHMLELADAAGEGGRAALDAFVQDKLVGSLLLIHGLHPLDAETRVREALAPIERRLNGQHLVFEGVEGGVARVRIDSNGTGAVPPGLAGAVERAVAAAAPELDGVKVETPAKLVQIGPAPGA
jgi:hypothetical protein